MTRIIIRLSVLSALLLPALALASPQSHSHQPHGSFVEIDNDFNGRVEVYIGGSYAGMVLPDRVMMFPAMPGNRTVIVRTTRGGVLANRSVHLHRGATSHIDVKATQAVLRVTNPSHLSMRVIVDGQPSWIAAHTSQFLVVESGNQRMVTEVIDGRGLRVISNESIWVQPYGQSQKTLAFNTPRRATQRVSSCHTDLPVRAPMVHHEPHYSEQPHSRSAVHGDVRVGVAPGVRIGVRF
ncbi:MAG: hypothetical protein GWP91_21035 [Rhodobacterales bacterium]|nr:hypothetical protein [Rhodobacterales bacterium]